MNRIRRMRPAGEAGVRQQNDRLLTENTKLEVKLEKATQRIEDLRAEIVQLKDALRIHERFQGGTGRYYGLPDRHRYRLRADIDPGHLTEEQAVQVHMLLRILIDRALDQVSELTGQGVTGRLELRQGDKMKPKADYTFDNGAAYVTWPTSNAATNMSVTITP